MNAEQIQGIVRSVLIAAGTAVLVKPGYIDQGTLALVVGAFMTLGGIGWSVFSNRSGKMIA
jgi:hypothetical protein